MTLSNRVRVLKESSTLKVNALVNKMKAEGQLVHNLTAGEPDFHAPDIAKKAVRDALDQNLSKYTPTAGIPVLRQLIADRTNRQQSALNRPWQSSDVVVTNGGKQAIFNTVLALVNPGDEVVFSSPYWLSYPEMVRAAEGVPVVVPTSLDSHYRLNADALRAALTPRTKLFILNSPSNPTGSMYSEKELQALGEVLDAYPQVWILSDEIYDRIDFTGGGWRSFLQACPQLRDRTVTVNGLSKSGAMTGWRIGWSVAPATLTAGLIALQGHSTSGICSLSQAAAVATLTLPEDAFEEQRRQYLHRRDLALEILRKSAKMKVFEPEGAFYFFIDVSGALRTDIATGKNENADGFAERLLHEIKVAVVSCVDFGSPAAIRISFATDEKTLTTACDLLVRYIG